jgi:hypothetical protein
MSVPISSRKRVSRLLATTLILVAAVAAMPRADDAGADAPARAFLDSLGDRLELEPGTCPADLPEVPGELRCGRVPAADVFEAAQREAMRFAERGVPVLDLQFWDGVPPHQLAGLPGFRPLPPVPGYRRVAYLFEGNRVGIWIGCERADGDRFASCADRSQRVLLSLEPLEGPFPLDLPALLAETPRAVK